MDSAVVVTLVIGLITAILAGFTLIVGKENKTSENRQAWINDQRNDLAEAIASAIAYLHVASVKEQKNHLESFDRVHARIELRENPKPNEWSIVRNSLNEIRASLVSATATERTISTQRSIIINFSRVELKKNWKIVKNGETFFAVFKWVFVICLGILALTLLVVNGMSAFGDTQGLRPRVERTRDVAASAATSSTVVIAPPPKAVRKAPGAS